MKNGFIKTAAAGIEVQVADCYANGKAIVQKAEEAARLGAKVIVFPELCVTGYTCGDLFWHKTLLDGARDTIDEIIKGTQKLDALIAVGAPFALDNALYNCAFLFCRGTLLGIVPKQNLPNYGEFYEGRNFAPGPSAPKWVGWNGLKVPFGAQLLFVCDTVPGLVVGAEVCEDMWVLDQPAQGLCAAGATVILNLSASNEVVGKRAFRQDLIKAFSGRGVCGYVYADAGVGESTTDLVFAGHQIIADNGKIIAQTPLFQNQTAYGVIDVERLLGERRRLNTFQNKEPELLRVPFSLEVTETPLPSIDPAPFVPKEYRALEQRCEEILSIQAQGLRKRLAHTHVKTAVVGISGGLDSTLALLVTARAFDLMGKNKKEILAVTMPCFGTTDRTYQNALKMIECVGATRKEIRISDAVALHLEQIGHSMDVHDVTYENAQARERTQILMDLANQESGMVIGTGDMSELALGWATYNGDHMSMYGVNCSVPKTLVRFLVKYLADCTKDSLLKSVLYDIMDTPVSPELLPPEDGQIAQKTEDLVGPYELHDFFLYYFLRFQFSPQKILRLAQAAFEGTYPQEVIQKWLAVFFKRFFSQQYKRSCVPDGPKVGTVSLSPRGDLRMPSDAEAALWLAGLES